MQVKFSTLIFFLLFTTAQLLLFLIGETFVTVGVVSLFFCYMYGIAARSTVSFPAALPPAISRSLLLLSVYTLYAVFSLFFTVSIPGTVLGVFLLCFSISFLSFFIRLPEKHYPTHLFIQVFLVLSGVLAALTILFFFFPSVLAHFSILNFVVANFGHNHAGAFFLFVLPIAFSVWRHRTWGKWSWLPIVWNVTAVSLSFGRVFLFLGITAVGFLVWQSRSRLSKLQKIFAVGVAGVLVSTLGILLLPSVVPLFTHHAFCPFPSHQLQLCKSLSQEQRFAYWQYAFSAFRDRPFGWGAHTFEQVVPQYLYATEIFSSFAHNTILQSLAELGSVGGILWTVWLVSIVKILVDLFQYYKKKKQVPIEYYLGVGVLLLLVDSLFDYNVQLWPMWIIFLCGVGLLFRQYCHLFPTKKRTHLQYIVRTSTLLTSLCSIMIVTSLTLWLLGQQTLSLFTFPFFEETVREQIVAVPAQQRAWLFSLYRHHTFVAKEQFQFASSHQEKKTIAAHLIELDPTDLTLYAAYLDTLIETADTTAMIQMWQHLHARFPERKYWVGQRSTLVEVANTSVSYANRLAATEPKSAIILFQSIYTFDPYLIEGMPFVVLSQPYTYTPDQIIGFLHNVELTGLWQYHATLSRWLLTQTDHALQQSKYADALELTTTALSLDPKAANTIWTMFSELYFHQAQGQLRKHDLGNLRFTLETWQLFFERVTTITPTIDETSRRNLARMWTQLGLRYVSIDPAGMAKLFTVAQNTDPYFFSIESPLTLQTQQAQDALWQVVQLYRQNKNTIPFFPADGYHLIAVQKLANTAIEQHNWAKTIQILEFMAEQYPTDYWASAQLGHFYLSQGQKEVAEKTYQTCLQRFGDQPTDCRYGLETLHKNLPRQTIRYWHASQEILSY